MFRLLKKALLQFTTKIKAYLVLFLVILVLGIFVGYYIIRSIMTTQYITIRIIGVILNVTLIPYFLVIWAS